MVMNKKAKLAHEKRKSGEGDNNYSRFAPSQIIGEVAWPKGDKNILVDLDGNGTLAIVDRQFVLSGDDGLKPALVACPAVYDTIARDEAIQRHSAYAGS